MNKYKWKWNNGKTRGEHRLIIEKHLGRTLKTSEHVHHINGIKGDNRLDNLEVLDQCKHHSQDVKKYLLGGSEKAKEQIENCRLLGYKRRKIPLNKLSKIRKEHARGKSYYRLAKEYGVTPQAIFYACKFKNKIEELAYAK